MSDKKPVFFVDLGSFEAGMEDEEVSVTQGNTAMIPCKPPTSRPPLTVTFQHNGHTVDLTQGELPIP